MRSWDIYIIDPWSKIMCHNPVSFELRPGVAQSKKTHHHLEELLQKTAAAAHNDLALPLPTG